jgi:hypothetical protein
MAKNKTKEAEAPEEEVQKKEIRYLSKASISGKNKMFKCDVLTGKVSRIKPQKQYFENTKTKVVTAEFYIEVEQNEFYTSAVSIEDAKSKFGEIFFDIEKKIAEQGEEAVLNTQEQVFEKL